MTALLLVAGYALGFLVVNNYLANYGVRELEPLRARYLAAAVPFAAFVALTVFVALETYRGIHAEARYDLRGWPRAAFALASLTVVVMASLALDLIVLFYLGALPTSSLTDAVGYSVPVLVFCGGVVGLVYGVRGRGRTTWRAWLMTNDAFTTLGLALFTVGTYATTIYPSIPTWLGGGRPDDVELAVSSAVSAVCAPCAQGATLKLIDEETTRIVVLVTDARGTRAVEISRSEVQAISHKPKSTPQP